MNISGLLKAAFHLLASVSVLIHSSRVFVDAGKFHSIVTPMSTENVDTSQPGKRSAHAKESADAHTNLGGGAINEKHRKFGEVTPLPSITLQGNQETARDENRSNFDPENVLSHALHALVGLDRYPHYLNRFSRYEEDITSLEQALEKGLRDVRAQKARMMTRRIDIERLTRESCQRMDLGTVDDEAMGEVAATGLDGDGREKNATKSEGCSLTSLPFPFRPPASWGEVRREVLHPAASAAIFKSKCFTSRTQPELTVDHVCSGKAAVQLDQALLEDWIDQEMFDVYSFPLLSDKFCATLKKIVRTVSSMSEGNEWAHLGLGRRPVDLDMIGLRWVNDLMLHLVIRPVARELFKESEIKGDLDWRHGYVAGYSRDASPDAALTRDHLVSHTDDSEVTLNVCIGDSFEGGSLQFSGLRGTEGEGKVIESFDPVPGRALLHAGRHLHAVTKVTSGDRYAYIIWGRSWSGVRSQSCPCCWLNRRQDARCICAPRWN